MWEKNCHISHYKNPNKKLSQVPSVFRGNLLLLGKTKLLPPLKTKLLEVASWTQTTSKTMSNGVKTWYFIVIITKL